MARRVSREEADRLLSDVASENSFLFSNGVNVRNIYELLSAIKYSEESTFRHHFNAHKNDFETWVANSVGDNYLAEKLKKIRTREQAIKKIHERIFELEKMSMHSKDKPVTHPYLSANDFFLENFGIDIKSFIVGMFLGLVFALIIAGTWF